VEELHEFPASDRDFDGIGHGGGKLQEFVAPYWAKFTLPLVSVAF
jgi:hypothetical protein